MRAGLERPLDLDTTGETPKAWAARQDDTMMVVKSFMILGVYKNNEQRTTDAL